jgi:hypothetical protein
VAKRGNSIEYTLLRLRQRPQGVSRTILLSPSTPSVPACVGVLCGKSLCEVCPLWVACAKMGIHSRRLAVRYIEIGKFLLEMFNLGKVKHRNVGIVRVLR